jgi:hypothetical protein
MSQSSNRPQVSRHCPKYVAITEIIIWTKRARRDFDDHYCTTLEDELSSDRKNG